MGWVALSRFFDCDSTFGYFLRDVSRGSIMWYSTMFWRWSDSFDSSGRVKFGSKFLPILIFESISWGRFWCETFERMSLDSLLSTVFFGESSWKKSWHFFLEGEWYLVGNLGMNVILGPSIRWMEVLPQDVISDFSLTTSYLSGRVAVIRKFTVYFCVFFHQRLFISHSKGPPPVVNVIYVPVD